MRLAFSNIKSVSSTLELQPPCVVFTGRGSSGKTAHMDAIRLAMTGRCSVGASVAKLQAICNAQGWATLECDNWQASWKMTGGSRTHQFAMGGNPCTLADIAGRSPATVGDLLSLTGEEQWSLVESLAGEDSSTNLASDLHAKIKIAKSKLESIELAKPPAPYVGPPLAVLEQRLAELDLEIALQTSLGDASQRIQRLQGELDLVRRAATATRSKIEDAEITLSNARNELALLDGKVRLWLATDGKEPAVVRQARAEGKTRHEAIFFLLDQVYTLASAARELASVGGMSGTKGACSALCAKIQDAQAAHEDEADFGDTLQPTLPEFVNFDPDASRSLLEQSIASKEESLSHLRHKLESEQQMIARYESQLLEIGPACPMNHAELDAKCQERNGLRAQVAAASAWMTWQADGERRKELARAARSELDELQSQDESLRASRARALQEAMDSVASKATQYVKDLGWRLVLEAGSSARKQWLVVRNQAGVELQAMAGNEQAIFGLALLCAIQDLEGAEFPVLFHECAEIEPERLKVVAEAIAKYRQRGCVFLSHWASPMCGSTVMEVRV